MRSTSQNNRWWLLVLFLAGLLIVMLVILFLFSGGIRNRFFTMITFPTVTPPPAVTLAAPSQTATPLFANGQPSPPVIGTAPPVLTETVQPTAIPSQAASPGVPSSVATAPGIQPYLAQNNGKAWALVFSDDFNNGHLDQSKWVTCYWWDNNGCTNTGNHELEWYLPQNIGFDGQSVKLVARPQVVQASDGNTYQYSSGMITTGRFSNNPADPVKFSFEYGFAEIQAKVPRGQGIWPAFWMLPANNAAHPEIDVMEVIGMDPNAVNMTIHYQQSNGTVIKDGSSWTGSQDLSQDWHIYAVDWEPTSIIWYVDGVERWRYTQQSQIPAEPMYLLLNLAVGGDWPGNPDDTTTFPSIFQINYVRVWQSAHP